MKFIFFNKIFWPLLLLLIAIIFWYPITKILVLVEKLGIINFHNILYQSSDIRLNLKEFATHGILITLLVFTVISALLIYTFNRNKTWSKPLLLGILSVLFIGGIGSNGSNGSNGSIGPIFANAQHQYKYVEISKPVKYQEEGKLLAQIQFIKLNPTFKNYLELAMDNKIKCYLQTQIIYNETDHKIKVNDSIEASDNKKIVLNTAFLKSFIQNPTLKLETELNKDGQLIYRDLSDSILAERADLVLINNKSVESNNKQNNLLIYFKFETSNGKPLAVFL